MGLYLCVFAGEADDEIAGVEVGSYDDFHAFRQAVADQLEGGRWGALFPVLMMHSDSDGVWTAERAGRLAQELEAIARAFARLPPGEVPAGWQTEVVSRVGLSPPVSLLDTYFDVDGAPLVERLINLAEVARRSGQPIWFQ